MKNDYQIAFIDIDWTILDHNTKDWDYPSLEAIKKLQQMGVLIVFATARSYASVVGTDLFNLIIGGSAIGILAYILTGCIYEKKSAPALGSFLYTISYILITFSFYGVSLLINNIIWATIIYLILYIMLCIALSFFKRETVHF